LVDFVRDEASRLLGGLKQTHFRFFLASASASGKRSWGETQWRSQGFWLMNILTHRAQAGKIVFAPPAVRNRPETHPLENRSLASWLCWL
jgi:hypothetical protein